VLEQTGVDPGCLQLEIIETIAMGDAEKPKHYKHPSLVYPDLTKAQ